MRTVARAPAYRGRGVGPLAVAEALRVLRESGAPDIELSVEAGNERALDLYRRFAFEVTGRTRVLALELQKLSSRGP